MRGAGAREDHSEAAPTLPAGVLATACHLAPPASMIVPLPTASSVDIAFQAADYRYSPPLPSSNLFGCSGRHRLRLRK